MVSIVMYSHMSTEMVSIAMYSLQAGVSPSEAHADGTAAIGGATGDVLPKIDLNKNYSVISGEEIPIIPVDEGEDQVQTTQATPAATSLAYYP